jgi:protein O-GlcNAc transferase
LAETFGNRELERAMTSKSTENLPQMVEQARALHQEGRFSDAQAIYCKILEIQPAHFDVLNLLGVLSGQTKNLGQAVDYFDRAICVAPDNASAHCNRGLALRELHRLEDALASFDRAIALNGNDAVAYYYRANIYQELGQQEQALADYDKCITIRPEFAPAYFNRATALQCLQQLEAALASYERAIALKEGYVEAYVNRGYVLHQLKRFGEAVASYEHAISIRPEPVAYLYLGNALQDLGRRDAALLSYDLAIDLNPGYAQAHANRGVLLYEIGNTEGALASYDHALRVKPDYAETYFNRGSVLRAIQRFEPAIADLEKAAALLPDLPFLAGALLEAKLQVCDWEGIENSVKRVNAGIECGEPTAHPFAFLTFSGDPQLQRKAAEVFVRETCPADDSLGAIAKRAAEGRIRVAYFSADFREHPVSRLLAELIEIHDRRRFDVIALSFGPETNDPMRNRLKDSFDEFMDVRGQSDRDIALLARSLNIDIAVDLGGYTANNRIKVFAMRAAPIQVSYLGYPGTTGSTYMDYLVADGTLIAAEDRKYYSEKIIYLPSFQANDSKRRISDRIFTREELQLPPDGFVFCCFNTSYKIMPETFGAWMRILSRVPGSVVLLDAKTETIANNLRNEARSRGIDPGRLVFGAPLTLPDWLARHRVADLFLDTLPYNAGTTASDALWAGLPVLTRFGSSFTGRMAASLLRSIDLPELITSSSQQYEDLAVELALNPERLAQIRRRLAQNRLTTPLFDQKIFARHLEAAYHSAQERYLAELAPDHIYSS